MVIVPREYSSTCLQTVHNILILLGNPKPIPGGNICLNLPISDIIKGCHHLGKYGPLDVVGEPPQLIMHLLKYINKYGHHFGLYVLNHPTVR